MPAHSPGHFLSARRGGEARTGPGCCGASCHDDGSANCKAESRLNISQDGRHCVDAERDQVEKEKARRTAASIAPRAVRLVPSRAPHRPLNPRTPATAIACGSIYCPLAKG